MLPRVTSSPNRTAKASASDSGADADDAEPPSGRSPADPAGASPRPQFTLEDGATQPGEPTSGEPAKPGGGSGQPRRPAPPGGQAGQPPKKAGADPGGPKKAGPEAAGQPPKQAGPEAAGQPPKQAGPEAAGQPPKKAGPEAAGQPPKKGTDRKARPGTGKLGSSGPKRSGPTPPKTRRPGGAKGGPAKPAARPGSPPKRAPDSADPPAGRLAETEASPRPTSRLAETEASPRPDPDASESSLEALDVGEPTPRPAPAPIGQMRYFEEATELLVNVMEGIEEEEVIGWAHDRIDPDTMGANGLTWYVLRERFAKRFVCYYSKRMSFLMNRTLATNFMPSGILRRCEQTENLSEIALKAPLIVVLDATCPEIMTDFSRILRRTKQVREKPILFFDHHRKGDSDIEDLPNATGYRGEGAQATSAIMLHIARNLGLDLRASEEGFRLAVVARAGIDTDLIGVDPSGYTDSTLAAIDYLDEVLGERGHEILEKLRAIKHPLTWYSKLGEALSEVENFDPTIAVVGLGVIDDTGIVPFVANRLLEVGAFKTTIVFGLVYDRIEGQIISVDLDASGRSNQDTEVVLPDLFHEIFFVTSPDGRKTSKGGGRANMLMGDYSGAGASVPLDYWRQLGTKSADEKIQLLNRLAWPAEFIRLRHLLTSRIHSLKATEVRSVVPIPGLDGL